MATDHSIIQLTPPSQAFIDNRFTTLGPWVLGGFFDAILMGVVLCQVQNYFRMRHSSEGFHRTYTWLVLLVTFVSVLKTTQSIAIVWEQNVREFANPDVARTLLNAAWWQVGAPLMTGITGFIVQSFFATRFYLLSRNIFLLAPIVAAMILSLLGACFSLVYIAKDNAILKVRWLLIHLVSTFIADFLITSGTIWSLRKRRTAALERTVSVVNRLIRLVFESAFPVTIVAAVDLILTQTLGTKLLWHLVLNYALAKLYAISLLYTVNSIVEYREKITGTVQYSSHSQRFSLSNVRFTRRGDIALTSPRGIDQVFVETQVSTHIDSGLEDPKVHRTESGDDNVRHLDVLRKNGFVQPIF